MKQETLQEMPHKYKGSQKTTIKNYMPEIGQSTRSG